MFENIEKQNREGAEDIKHKEGTMFYKPFSKKEKKERGIKIEEVKEKENKEEENRILKERFTELALLLEGGALRTEVDVSGETHSLKLKDFLKDGKVKASNELVDEVNRGLDTKRIDIKFKLQWTKGRQEVLILECTTPANSLLKGGGDIAKELNKKITGIFAGTSSHYKKIESERMKQKEKTEGGEENEQIPEQKEILLTNLKNTGAEIYEIEGPDRETIAANFPNKEKQIIITVMGGELPWHIDFIRQKNIEKSFVTSQPKEILPEITKYVEIEK